MVAAAVNYDVLLASGPGTGRDLRHGDCRGQPTGPFFRSLVGFTSGFGWLRRWRDGMLDSPAPFHAAPAFGNVDAHGSCR
jgi:hypothetical protein